MGLICKAIMTGGAMYGVNKLAKTYEHTRTQQVQVSNSRGQPEDFSSQSQRAYYGPPPGYQGEGYYQDQQPQQRREPSKQQYQPRQYIAASEDDMPQFVPAPISEARGYYQSPLQGQQQYEYAPTSSRTSGYVVEEESFDQPRGRSPKNMLGGSSSGGSFNPEMAIQMATEFLSKRK